MADSPQPGDVTVAVLWRDLADARSLGLELLAGADGLQRPITLPHPQKTGLALAGYESYLRDGRVLVLAESELSYLSSLPPHDRVSVLRRVFAHAIPCVILTDGLEPAPELAIEAERAALPVLRTRASTSEAMTRITAELDTHLGPRGTIHGVLVDILGLGVLMVGESGIGKSESALDLVMRGHRLIADDAVDLRCRAGSFVLGSCPDLTRHHMEIRGLGLISIQDLFGVAATRPSKRVELVVQLERWEPGREYDRLGVDAATYELLGVKIPTLRMPVAPGRNIATLVEVAARNQLLRAGGRDAARRLVARADARLAGRDDADGVHDAGEEL
jgi:HPr kinase/phosphorylase